MNPLQQLPVIRDPRGNLTFAQCADHIPFDIGRIAWVHDIRTRGSVALGRRDVPRMIVALSGSFEAVAGGASLHLIDPAVAITVPAGDDLMLCRISHNAVALVIEGGGAPCGCDITPDEADGASHARSLVDDARVMRLDTHDDGDRTVTSQPDGLFALRRLFYLYDVPAGSTRGGHSHHRAHELIIAASGSFDVTLTDGHDTVTHRLSDPRRGLYIPPGLWRTIDGFSSGSVCLVNTSEPYSEADYVRDYERFKVLTSNKITR